MPFQIGNKFGFKKGYTPYNKNLPSNLQGHWKGGRIIEKEKYVLIKNNIHPYCNNKGYVREHRLVMEKLIGRYLKPEEVVHHINGDPADNRIDNLQLFANESEHECSVPHRYGKFIYKNRKKEYYREYNKKYYTKHRCLPTPMSR